MTNMPKDKTPREVKIIESAEDGGFVAVYGTFSGIGTTKEDAYRELCVALSLATEVFEDELAAERQNRCPQCEAGNKPWWDYAWMHTINGTNIDCRGRYPDPMTPHGKDFYEEITEQIMKITSLKAELVETNKLRTESRSREATHLGKIASLEQELAEALDELIPLRMVHNAYATCCKERKELTAENDRLTIKATNWEIVAAGFEEWAIHLRDEINEALSFGPTYKPELKGWVAQFVEWQKRMRESIWIKKPEALTSPKAPEKSDYSAKCAFCGGRTFLRPEEIHEPIFVCSCDGGPKSGDSAGPEKCEIADGYCYTHWCIPRNCNRAKGKEDGHE